MEVIDLNGFMFSGKAAVSDILREFEDVYVPNYRHEFDLLRIGDGLIDFSNAIEDWSPIRTNHALNRFEKVMKKVISESNFPSNLVTTNWAYKNKYPNIEKELKILLKEIVELEWETPWPYDDLYENGLNTFIRKILNKINVLRFRHFRQVDKVKFKFLAPKFIEEILTFNLNKQQYTHIVTHNSLEPYNPGKNLWLLGQNAKSIVVDRDPRDLFATSITSQIGFNDNKIYKYISAANDVEVFIKKYKLTRQKIVNHDSVLRLNFEDLVFNYETTLETIIKFLNLNISTHKWKMKYFNPNSSKENTRMWMLPEFNKYKNEFHRISIECNLEN
jgi:hypothetical protein